MIKSANTTANASWAPKFGTMSGLVRHAFASLPCPESLNRVTGYEQIDQQKPGFLHT